jgi:phenylpropionate dioxygenase-like ring-hydroxylating dioxygenase large terminal subunit
MFLRDAWYVAAEARELGTAPLGRMILGEPVVLYRKQDGTPAALEDRCCHRRAPLHKGEVVGDALQCGYHGFQFAADGSCIKTPGQAIPPRGARVRSYPVVQRHGYAWLWMGDASRADPALIPDFRTNDDAAWAATGMRMPVKASYLLLVDNLLDLSHVAFVHKGTIGGSDDTSATLKLDRAEGFVRLTRTALDVETPPHNRKQGFAPRSDQIKVMTFVPPCNIILDITTTERSDREPRKRMHILLLNSITPETETSSHYFWSSTRDFEVANPQITEFFQRETSRAFAEDIVILEAQQACIDLDPSAPTVDVTGDAGSIHARRLVDRLLAAERTAHAAE